MERETGSVGEQEQYRSFEESGIRFMRMEDSCLVGWIPQSQFDVLAGPQ
jgi:hypothetical protein